MDTKVIGGFGHHDGGRSFSAQLYNGGIVRDWGTLPILNFNEDVLGIGVFHHNIDFLPTLAAAIVSHRCGLLIIKCGHMLVNSGLHHFTHLYRVTQHGIVHQNRIANRRVGNIDLGAGFENLFPCHIDRPALINQVGAFQIFNIIFDGGPGNAIQFLRNCLDRNDLRRNIAEIEEDSLQFCCVADLVKGGQVPLEHFVHHIFPHDLLGQDVIVGQGQFGESAYLQIAIKVILYLRELQHDLGTFLLGLIHQRRDLQVIRQVGAIHIQQLTILIERQCRNLDGRPSPGAALLAPLDQNRTG